MNDLINKPEEYKIYSIHYFKKEYQVVAEVLFALILDEIIQKVKKEYILDKTIVELPMKNKTLRERINVSLDAIGMKGIEIEEITFDYTPQGEILHELLEKKSEYEKYQRMIEKAKQFTETEDERKRLNECQNKIYSEESFNNEIVKQFNTKERSRMKLTQLDNYCLFITSRHFNSLADHQNFTQVATKLKLNMEKFYYNPISVTQQTRRYFPNWK